MCLSHFATQSKRTLASHVENIAPRASVACISNVLVGPSNEDEDEEDEEDDKDDEDDEREEDDDNGDGLLSDWRSRDRKNGENVEVDNALAKCSFLLSLVSLALVFDRATGDGNGGLNPPRLLSYAAKT